MHVSISFIFRSFSLSAWIHMCLMLQFKFIFKLQTETLKQKSFCVYRPNIDRFECELKATKSFPPNCCSSTCRYAICVSNMFHLLASACIYFPCVIYCLFVEWISTLFTFWLTDWLIWFPTNRVKKKSSTQILKTFAKNEMATFCLFACKLNFHH